MASKSFSSQDAKQIIEKFRLMTEKLAEASKLEGEYKKSVRKSVDKLTSAEAQEILKGIPVEELNREKKGIKTKLLRDNGFSTVWDVNAASAYRLASIKGISEESAANIKRTASDFIKRTSKTVKIRLSADDRNAAATELVSALSVYRKSYGVIDRCKELLFEDQKRTETAMAELKPATGFFRWLFASKAQKERACAAYEYLRSEEANAFYSNAKATVSELDAIRRSATYGAWADFSGNTAEFFSILEKIAPGALGNDDTVYGLPEDLAREIAKQPLHLDGLKCSLRRYQEWGVKYIIHQKKALLGDEMGLGKTIQAIAAMTSLSNEGATHFAVVCPAGVLANWCREIEKHSALRAIKIHGAGRNSAFRSWIAKGGVAVTTYETTAFLQLDEKFKYTMLTVDEAHYIKNPEARRTVNTVRLAGYAERLLFMTGTALENKVDEMIELVNILSPNVANKVKNIAFMSSAPQFREKIAPVYYRRKREDVLTELPELIESKEWCPMLPEEKKVYETAVLEGRYADARRVSWNVDELKNSSKARRLAEIVEEAEAEGRKVIVFSFFLDTVAKVRQLLGDRCMPHINGSVSPLRRQEIIDEFDKAPAGAVLPAQIQSGGTGLNIQSASVVIICEPQFKPSIEKQAISRAYRMGQARNVLVYRLLCEDTLDERITDMLENKQRIFDAFADSSAVADESMELDEKAFGSIMEEEAKRINQKNNASGKKQSSEQEER